MNVDDVCNAQHTEAHIRQDLIHKLRRVYARTNTGATPSGKRQALPSEIERAVRAARPTSGQEGTESR
jgi:hypothetical protein